MSTTVCFQFLGIPPKGEHWVVRAIQREEGQVGFQFLGIPPKGEQARGVPQRLLF